MSESSTQEENGLTRFLMKVKESIDVSADDEAKPEEKETTEPSSVSFSYTLDYKPEMSDGSKVLYSYNELKSFSDKVSEEEMARVVSTLPSKKFWRLNSGSSSNRRGGNAKGHDDKPIGKDRNAQGSRNNRNSRNKRQGSKKSEQENNDVYIALEEQIESTGNPMADFENWRNKMKELERKKKGLDQDGKEKSDAGATTQSFSSISDFFNLKPDDQKTVTLEELEPATPSVNDEEPNVSKSHEQTGSSTTNKGTSSRFSSFFHTDTSAEKTDNHPIAKPPSHSSSEDSRPAAGSRLLSLFSNESRSLENNIEEKKTESIRQQSRESPTASLSSVASSNNSQPAISHGGSEKDTSGSMFLKSLIAKGSDQVPKQPVSTGTVPPPGLLQQAHNQPFPHQHPHHQPIPPHNPQQPNSQHQKMPLIGGQMQPPGLPMGLPPQMMGPPVGIPPQHFQHYNMNAPPPGMGQPPIASNGTGFPEQFVNRKQPGNQEGQTQPQPNQNRQQPFMVPAPGMPMAPFNGQSIPMPPQGFPQSGFPYGQPVMPPHFQQQHQPGFQNQQHQQLPSQHPHQHHQTGQQGPR